LNQTKSFFYLKAGKGEDALFLNPPKGASIGATAKAARKIGAVGAASRACRSVNDSRPSFHFLFVFVGNYLFHFFLHGFILRFGLFNLILSYILIFFNTRAKKVYCEDCTNNFVKNAN
jgi:hypothetical protein